MKSLFASFLLVCACCGTDKAPAEEYAPTQNIDEFSVKMIFIADKDVITTCQKLGAWPGEYVTGKRGCSAFYPDRKPTPHCLIIVPAPRYINDLATLIAGHELLHCVHGKYHTE